MIIERYINLLRIHKNNLIIREMLELLYVYKNQISNMRCGFSQFITS